MTPIEFFDEVYRAHARYWHHATRESMDPADFGEPWQTLLHRLSARRRGRALDLGAGEGGDAIRLARLGYRVDAVEGSHVAAEKIRRFAREAGVPINIEVADATSFRPARSYDVIVCSGVLHYLAPGDQDRVLAVIKEATAPDGLNLIATFTDSSPVPHCHRIVDVFPDAEDGLVASAYRDWTVRKVLEREKLETSHHDFPEHRHSFIKLLAQRPPDR